MRSLHGAPPTMLGDDRGGHIDWFGSDGTTIAWGSRGYPILLVASDEIVFGSPSGSDVLADLHRIDPRTLTFS